MKISKKIPLAFIGYLVILLIILISWRNIESAPPLYQRLLFVVASLIPAYIYQKTLLPIIACFSTISYYGYAHTYFPAELMYIIPMLLIVAFFKKKESAYLKKGNPIILFLAIFTAFVDLVTSGQIHLVSLSFFAIFLIEVLFDSGEESLQLFGYALCVSSVVLSLEFFFVSDEMVREYESLGMSRVFLRDPNYYGITIAAGAVIAFRMLLSKKEKSLFEKLLYISTIVISFITIVLNASRGAMLSFSLCCIFLVLLYPTKMRFKVLIIVAAVIGIYFLYQNEYFALMQYRIESDSGTGSNRVIIWQSKLEAFLQESNIFNLMFGVGYSAAIKMGIAVGFHNDFLAMLLEYGIVGFVLLICLFVRPIRLADKNSLVEMSILVLFLVVGCSTVEPVTAGRYANLFFYVYIEKLVLLNKEKNKRVFVINQFQ